MCSHLALLCVLLMSALSVVLVSGYSYYDSDIPNGNNVRVNFVPVLGVGHEMTDGSGPRNAFGTAFAIAGYSWTNALCNADSDGDGFSNGMELGDPDCVWSFGQTPARTTGITHPGFASSIPTTTTIITTSGTTATTSDGSVTSTPTTIPTTTTTTIPTTTTTSAPSSTNGLSADVQVLAGMRAGWGLCTGRSDIACGGSLSTASDQSSVLVTLEFSNSVGAWGGMGFSTASMAGHAVACGLADGVASRVVCMLFDTFSYGVTPKMAVGLGASASGNATTFTVHSSSITSAGATVTFRIDRSLVGAQEGDRRAIFAIGNMQTAAMSSLYATLDATSTKRLTSFSSPLNQHSSRAAGRVNLAASEGFTLLSDDSTYLAYTYVVVGVVLLLVGLVAQFVYRVMDPLACAGPITNMIAHGSMALLLLVVLPIVVLVLMREHYANSTVPWFRAMGEVAKYGFFLVLLPVCHRVSLPAIFLRTSYERSTGMHAAVGIFILLAVTIHGVGMAVKGVDSLSDITKVDTPKKNLYGLLAWITLVLVSIPAMLRSRLPRMFATFRISHMLVVLVIVFGVLHAPSLALVMIPGFVMYGGDLVWRGYNVFIANRGANVVAAEYNAEAGVTALQVTCRGVQASECSDALVRGAGKHVLIRVGRLGPLPHPISIALTDPARGVVTLFIKNTGDTTRPASSSHRWTERLASMVKSSAQSLFAAENGQGKLFKAAVLGLVDSKAVVPLDTLLGHHSITNDSTTHIHVVLVAGGIGITPVLSYLQGMAGLGTDEHGEGMGVLRQVSVTVVWCVRGDGMRSYFEPLLQQLLGSMGTHLLFPSSLLPACRSGGPAVLSVKSTSLHIYQTGTLSSDTIPAREVKSLSKLTDTDTTVSTVVGVRKAKKWAVDVDVDDLAAPLSGNGGADVDSMMDEEMANVLGDDDDDGGRRLTSNGAMGFMPSIASGSAASKKPTTSKVTTTNHTGRPDIAALSRIVYDEGVGGDTTDAGAVYACGPEGVMGVAKGVARETGLLYHYEEFS